MKEILIVSGKGGTGKTSFVACFAKLSSNSLFCDCDVDASNLHLLLAPKVEETNQFYAGWQPNIDFSSCTLCGRCSSFCKFNAIKFKHGELHYIANLCEGCGVCADNCKANAITLTPRHCGQWHKSTTQYGSLFHAELFPGEENSGKLIAELRKAAKIEATKQNVDYIFSDGPPGIGCPVISSMSGVDQVIIVTEPTPSGIHDLKRVANLAHQFEIPVSLVINKWDLNSALSDEISSFCKVHDIDELGRISYNQLFSKALRDGKTILDVPDSIPALEIKNIYANFKSSKGK